MHTTDANMELFQGEIETWPKIGILATYMKKQKHLVFVCCKKQNKD